MSASETETVSETETMIMMMTPLNPQGLTLPARQFDAKLPQLPREELRLWLDMIFYFCSRHLLARERSRRFGMITEVVSCEICGATVAFDVYAAHLRTLHERVLRGQKAFIPLGS